jgi:hypothetical protein
VTHSKLKNIGFDCFLVPFCPLLLFSCAFFRLHVQ